MTKTIFKANCKHTECDLLRVTRSCIDENDIYIECSEGKGIDNNYIGIILDKETALKLCEAIKNNYK